MFSASSGQLSGTPSGASVGTYSNIVIAVSDGVRTATLPAFTVQVLANPASSPAPTITGTPPSGVTVGQSYSFTPSATDPASTALAFGIANQPSWATFSSSSGQLSGAPGTASVGTYSNIVIAVSDGVKSASLAPFSIQVTAAATSGNAGLTWDAPTLNTDGTTLTDLEGYIIAYGTSAGDLSQSVTIPNPTTTSYTLQGLAAGTWYFAVSAYASDATTSTVSNIVTKTIS
jgi:hypothetical protein